jgi:hypothetical protein
MSNVNLPTPVAVAVAALCLLGGYLLGVVTGPDTPSRTTAEVSRYDSGNNELCLVGDAIHEQDVEVDQELCGTWRGSPGSATPRPGDRFRFVIVTSTDSGAEPAVIIYGDVVD